MEAFLFGTRLSYISRHMQDRDVERALSEVSRSVPDWSGGTRIGQSLKDFDLSGALNGMIDIIQRYRIVLPSNCSMLLKVLVNLILLTTRTKFRLIETYRGHRVSIRLAMMFILARQIRRLLSAIKAAQNTRQE